MSGSDDNAAKKTEKVYHYTNEEAAKKIEASGMIYQSKKDSVNDDAAVGDGVYATKMSPSNDSYAIAKNNYDDAYSFPESQMKAGKVDYVVEIDIEKGKMEDHTTNTGRDVHLYPGKHLDLHGHDVKNYKIYPKDKST